MKTPFGFLIVTLLVTSLFLTSCSVSDDEGGVGDSESVEEQEEDVPTWEQTPEQYAKRRMRSTKPIVNIAPADLHQRPNKKPYPVIESYEPLKEKRQP